MNENEHKYNLNILEMNNMHVSDYIIKKKKFDNNIIGKNFSLRPEEAGL